MDKLKLLNIYLDNLSKSELLENLKTGILFTPNADHMIKLQQDRHFLEVYKLADYKVCDGQILLFIARLIGLPIKEKISGSDFLPAFYHYHRDNEDIRIFLLGAKEGVAKKAQTNINSKVGREIVIGTHSPSFEFEKNKNECSQIVEIINQSGATVLAVGVGAPKQEKFILQYKNKLPNIKIFMAIGATIDFEAGTIKRSPKWMSKMGLESLYRLWCEPRRLWKRYLVEDPAIFGLLLKQKLNLYVNPFETKEPDSMTDSVMTV